jgi:hypothetical protein
MCAVLRFTVQPCRLPTCLRMPVEAPCQSAFFDPQPEHLTQLPERRWDRACVARRIRGKPSPGWTPKFLAPFRVGDGVAVRTDLRGRVKPAGNTIRPVAHRWLGLELSPDFARSAVEYSTANCGRAFLAWMVRTKHIRSEVCAHHRDLDGGSLLYPPAPRGQCPQRLRAPRGGPYYCIVAIRLQRLRRRQVYWFVMSTSFVSGRKISATRKLTAAMMTGYHRPE